MPGGRVGRLSGWECLLVGRESQARPLAARPPVDRAGLGSRRKRSWSLSSLCLGSGAFSSPRPPLAAACAAEGILCHSLQEAVHRKHMHGDLFTSNSDTVQSPVTEHPPFMIFFLLFIYKLNSTLLRSFKNHTKKVHYTRIYC